MTREEILAMPAGRELDALVAEKVMGWEVNSHNPDYHIQYTDEHGNPYGMQMSEFEPSANISAAWQVAEKMNGEFAFEVGRAGERYGRRWTSRFGMLNEWVEADTAPEAICKAALLAVMEA